jgi:hypothetical protein
MIAFLPADLQLNSSVLNPNTVIQRKLSYTFEFGTGQVRGLYHLKR